jgi:hypothetical protein
VDDKTAKPAAPKAAAKKPDVLLFNRRSGWYCTSFNVSNGVQLASGQTRLSVTPVRIAPGLHFIPVASWEAIKANAGLQERIASGQLEVIEDWPKLKDKRCTDMVEASAHVETLDRLLELEERPKVAAAIETHLAECRATDAQVRQARRLQRAHHRANA